MRSSNRMIAIQASAILACVSLLAAACGARVAPYFGPASQAAVGPGAPQTGTNVAGLGGSAGQGNGATPTTLGSLGVASRPGISSGGTGSAGATGPAGTGSRPGASPAAIAAATAALGPTNFNLDPRAEAGYCPASNANGASDVGVTPTSISFGNVSGLSGVLSNNFNQGSEGVQALFSAVNASGGICGRKLQLKVEDDGQDVSHNASDVADLIPKSFAFVGSTSDADSGGVPEMQQAGIPDIGQAINFSRGQMPNYFTAGTYGALEKNGTDYIYDTLASGLKANGTLPKRMAFLAYSVPISALAARQFVKVFEGAGSQDCYEDENIQAFNPNLTSDVLTMQQRGCDGVFTTMDVTGNDKLLQAMANQGYHPVYAGTTLDGYTPAQISTAGQAAAQGFQVFLNFEPFNESNPAIKLYLSQLATYEPGKEPSAFGIEAWASAQMLLYALIKSGPNPTRASVVKVFNGLVNWDTNGAMAPVTPGTKNPGNCIIDMQVKGNDFVRVWPAQGFYCSNTLVAVPSS